MKSMFSWRLFCLFLLFLAALWYPVRKIREYEVPATKPLEFRFRVRGVDPNDPFRGRYLRLNIPLPRLTTSDLNARNYRFAVLEVDPEGFARIVTLAKKPDPTRPSLRIRYFGVQRNWRGNRPMSDGQHLFQLPFQRFYLNEKEAPAAERLLQEAERAELAVLVYPNGNYAVRDLLLDGEPLQEALRKIRQ